MGVKMKTKHHKKVINPKYLSVIASQVKSFIVWLAIWRIIPSKLVYLLIDWLGLRHV
jgi:hypothetical protein